MGSHSSKSKESHQAESSLWNSKVSSSPNLHYLARAAESSITLNNGETTRTQPQKGELSSLFPDILITIIVYHLSLYDIINLSETCSLYYNLINTELRQQIYKQQLRVIYWIDNPQNLYDKLIRTKLDDGYKGIFKRMWAFNTTFRGFAYDRATNEFVPYPMQLVINKTSYKRGKDEAFGKLNFQGGILWTTLDNGLTTVEGTVFDNMDKTKNRLTHDEFLLTAIPKICTFRETTIIRGDDIAVPNDYFSMSIGPLLFGMYNPGHPNFLGCFIMIMEEYYSCIEEEIELETRRKQERNFSLRSISSSPVKSLKISPPDSRISYLKINHVYKGILTHAIDGDKKGYHISYKLIEISETQVTGIFTIMLIRSPLKTAAKGQASITWPCEIAFTAQIKESNKISDEDDFIKLANHSNLENGTFSALPAKPRQEVHGAEEKASLEYNKIMEDIWIHSFIPFNYSELDRKVTLMKMGDLLVGFFSEPKVGIFYLKL